jgi:hypothetical protein
LRFDSRQHAGGLANILIRSSAPKKLISRTRFDAPSLEHLLRKQVLRFAYILIGISAGILTESTDCPQKRSQARASCYSSHNRT